MKDNLSHMVVIETTFPDGLVTCAVIRFRNLPISDMCEALTVVHTWEDRCGLDFRGEDEYGETLATGTAN